MTDTTANPGGITDGIPVVDLAAPLADVGRAIDRACREVGFFCVIGHGVDPALVPTLDRAARDFFARPDADKAHIAMRLGGPAWRGWFPLGGELTSGVPDHKEGLYFGRELPSDDPRVVAATPLHGPNLFPTEPVALRGAVLDAIEALTGVGRRVLAAMAVGLGLAPDWFERNLTADPTVLFRIFRYPPQPRDASDTWGVREHTDYGLITVLAHDGTPGLQVCAPDRSGRPEWLDVPTIEGAFVVNIGDMLEKLTAGRWRSTPHRVRHHGIGADGRADHDRLSFPLFLDPSWDATVVPLPLDAATAGAPPARGSARWDASDPLAWTGRYGDYLTAKVAKVFPELFSALG